MSSAQSSTARAAPSVFLSYASEDRKAAQALRDALLVGGIDVWYDESGLDGGDVWDQKIRRQIRECDFFMPVISAQTEVRPEGYFRREWRFAVERTLDMADDHPFLLPVVIDDTTQAGARVPDKFLAVQWSRVPGGQSNAALESLCRRLRSAQWLAPQAHKRTAEAPATPGAPLAGAPSAVRSAPEFPRAEPGQKLKYGVEIIGWAFRSAWFAFQRLPKWVRIIVYVWIAVLALSKGCSGSHEHRERLSQADTKRIQDIANRYQGNLNKGDVSQLATQIAREFAAAPAAAGAHPTLLAIPFGAPGDDAAAQKLADSSFAQTYGRVAVAQHGSVALIDQPSSDLDASAAAELGRSHHASYVLYGAVDPRASPPSLLVRILDVSDKSVSWSQSYPLAGTDPAKIAADVDKQVQELED
jgi:TolB-like protein